MGRRRHALAVWKFLSGVYRMTVGEMLVVS
jgi:hypothetical protein